MTKVIKEEMRQQIAEFLPEAISKALQSYQVFTDQAEETGEPEKSKEFLDRHKACKEAISHLDSLIKLARWAELPEKNQDQNRALNDMLLEAQRRVKNYQNSDN